MKFAVAVVGALLLGAGAMVIGREKPSIQIVRELCEPVRIETFVPVSIAPSVAPELSAQPVPRVRVKQSAPPLPFRYMGRLIEDGKLEVFLLRGEEHFSVATGDRLGADYRVEQVTERAIVFTYLPLKIRQVLPL